jgi:hypothetical protein
MIDCELLKSKAFYLTPKAVDIQPLSESLAFDLFVFESVVAVDEAHYRDLRNDRKIFFTER